MISLLPLEENRQCRADDGSAFAAPDADAHFLTHKPSDPACDACLRGKLKNLRKYAGAFSRPTTKFGDIVTMDHCSFYDGGMQYSLNGKVISLVARDIHTTFGSVYPADSKSTENTIEALQSFVGDSPVKRFYSDNADELISAARHLKVAHEASQQGIPQTNGIIEREVQDMLTGTRTLLVAAGMPGYFWSYAAPCYMHLDNCVPHPKTGQTAWYRRYGEEFTGQLIPFGSAVIFKPSPTKYKTDKPLPAGMYGIFLGYRFAPGGAWNGEYLVEDLSYFADLDFRMDAPGHRKALSPHVTKQVRRPQGSTIPFPLKKHYDRINFSLEGILAGDTQQEVEFDLPE